VKESETRVSATHTQKLTGTKSKTQQQQKNKVHQQTTTTNQ